MGIASHTWEKSENAGKQSRHAQSPLILSGVRDDTAQTYHLKYSPARDRFRRSKIKVRPTINPGTLIGTAGGGWQVVKTKDRVHGARGRKVYKNVQAVEQSGRRAVKLRVSLDTLCDFKGTKREHTGTRSPLCAMGVRTRETIMGPLVG